MITTSFSKPKSQIAKWDAVEFGNTIECYSVDGISDMAAFELEDYSDKPLDMQGEDFEEELQKKYNNL